MKEPKSYKSNDVTVDETLETEPTTNTIAGTVCDCKRLRVRKEPSLESDTIYTIAVGTIVVVDENKSTDDFYHIYTETGVDGFCMKRHITIEQ